MSFEGLLSGTMDEGLGTMLSQVITTIPKAPYTYVVYEIYLGLEGAPILVL